MKRDGAKAVQPLHERYKKVIQDKEMKIDALRQVQLEDEIEKDPDSFAPSFKPDTQISQNYVKGRTSKESFFSFLNEMQTWQLRKDKRLKELKNQREQTLKEVCTHKPELNLNSKRLIDQSKRAGTHTSSQP